MHKFITSFFAAAILLASITSSITASATAVSGVVTCDGRGIAGVAVSDGVNVVKTDKAGKYKLNSSLTYGYIFISIPSGYEVASSHGVIPDFFQYISPQEKAATADFKLKSVNQKKCNFLLINDIHLTNHHDPAQEDIKQLREGFVPDVSAHIKDLQGLPLYAITLGDMTTDGRWYKNNFFLPDYLKEMEFFPVPIFHAMGNHDNDMRGGGGDFNSSKAFRSQIGPSFYSFNVGAFHFVALDDIVYDNPLNEEGYVKKATEYHTYISEDQLSWLKKDMATVGRNTPVILFTHAPFYRIKSIMEDGMEKVLSGFSRQHSPMEVLDILKGHKVYILSGHTHQMYNVLVSDDILEHNNVAVAGSSWYTQAMLGHSMSADATPAGYSVYTIDGDTLSWYYKPIGYRVEDCQFTAYDMNTVPAEYRDESAQNTIWLNVYNFDDSWDISVKENGKELTVVRKYLTDPFYNMGIKGPLRSKGAFKPQPSSHMFSAVASSGDSTLEITVTDRFGRKFTQTMTRPKAFGLDMPIGNK